MFVAGHATLRFRSLCSAPLRIGWLVVLLAASGCARWDLPDRWTWGDKAKPAIPEKVVPMWTDTVLYQPGKPALRGFGAGLFL